MTTTTLLSSALITERPAIYVNVYIMTEVPFKDSVATAGCSIWSVCLSRRDMVVLMWSPQVTLFSSVDQSGATISWDALSIGGTGRVIMQGCWERCPTSRPLRHRPLWGGPAGCGWHGGKTAGCPQGYEGQGLFEVGRVATLWLHDPPRTPPYSLHITYGHLRKLPLGALGLPDPGGVTWERL